MPLLAFAVTSCHHSGRCRGDPAKFILQSTKSTLGRSNLCMKDSKSSLVRSIAVLPFLEDVKLNGYLQRYLISATRRASNSGRTDRRWYRVRRDISGYGAIFDPSNRIVGLLRAILIMLSFTVYFCTLQITSLVVSALLFGDETRWARSISIVSGAWSPKICQYFYCRNQFRYWDWFRQSSYTDILSSVPVLIIVQLVPVRI